MNTSTNSIQIPSFDIAIIGAGLAGSLCAHLLTQSGLTVCVIEKSRGSGGRAGSKRLDDDIRCDLGTPFISAKNKATQTLLDSLIKENIAAVWKQCSIDASQAFVGVPTMSAITRHWLSNATLITNTRIHHLQHLQDEIGEQTQWLLRDDRYQPVVSAKKIIITAPAPQAAALLSTNEKLAVLLLRANQACTDYQSQWAMWLETETSDLNALIEPNNTPLARIIKDNYKPMRNSDKVDRWVIQATNEWTQQHLDHDKVWITKRLLQAFSELTEQRVLKHGEPHRWFLSRFSENKGNNHCAWAPEHHVGLAGDWLCQGDAEGALLSAIALTNLIKNAQ